MSIASHLHAKSRVLLVVLVALGVTPLSGCASQAPVPVVSFPTVSDPPTINVEVPPVATAGDVPIPGAVTTKVLDLSGTPLKHTTNNTWVTFTVSVSNASTYVYLNILPIVVFGHCTCDPGGGGVAPHTVMQTWDPVNNVWNPSASVSADATGAYTFARQVPFATLGANQTLTYQYRVSLSNTSHAVGMQSGTGSIEVYILEMPGHTRISTDTKPDATVALGYDLG